MKTKRALVMLAIVAGISACQKEELTAPEPSTTTMDRSAQMLPVLLDIVDTKWVLRSLNSGVSVIQREMPWFELQNDGGVIGQTGCNSLTARYRLGESALSFGNLVSTRIYCPDVAEVEDSFIRALQNAENFRLENGQLVLLNGHFELARFEEH
jgi:heat shock protein HslJ